MKRDEVLSLIEIISSFCVGICFLYLIIFGTFNFLILEALFVILSLIVNIIRRKDGKDL